MAATAAHYSPMTRIYLSGSLARKFFRFKDYQLDSGCAWEGFKALKSSVDGFAEEIARLGRLGLRFAIFRNRKNSGENDWGTGGTREIRIVPVIAGSKRAGFLQTVLGVVLIAMSSITNGATLAPGIALTAGGVVQMLSPQLTGLNQSAAPENAASYAFGSAKNTTASGSIIPICIGRRTWGGVIISAGIYAEDKA
ncbi:tail assembly protein [Pseudomonas lactis]|uniref:tail assembly protein n=1 Tax=Pseudomonas lactis TaxID=1615674 RepID=UPI0014729401|nr:tail assembly protein [Pseudomonas lactis]NNA53216.1 tail assembly protein [Pseudomonas lactis]